LIWFGLYLAPLIGLTPWSVSSSCQPIDTVWCH
jgi:hypothetical protein